VRSFAKAYDLSHQTLFALLYPEWQTGQRPHGSEHGTVSLEKVQRCCSAALPHFGQTV
jgi:hypothetical protein